MATTTYKTLGQSAPAATTEADLYTVPASTSSIVSTVLIANRSSTEATFRISFSVGGAATATKDYIAYDVNLAGNGVQSFTIGATMAATDKIRVYASTANVSFTAFGSELA
jgi:hypothetical protein